MALSVKKILKAVDKLDPEVFNECGMGEVEDTVVDLLDMGEFDGMDVDAAAEYALKEIRSLYADADGQPDEAQEWESFDPDC
jgi:hypothetical protein